MQSLCRSADFHSHLTIMLTQILLDFRWCSSLTTMQFIKFPKVSETAGFFCKYIIACLHVTIYRKALSY